MRKWIALALGLLLTLGMALPAAAAPGQTGGVAGVVTDELGRPVGGAEVEVYRLGQGLMAVLPAGADGAFRLDTAVTAGSLWQFRAWAKGYHTLDTGWVDPSRSPYQALRLERLTGALHVAAVDRDGQPVTAAILVIGSGGEVAGDLPFAEGTADLDGLAPGQYQVVVRAPKLAQAARTVTVAAGSTASVLAVLEPAAIAVAGEVVDSSTGLPVAGASVELLRDDFTLLVDAGRTDADGAFRAGLAAGESGPVKVRVAAAGYRSTVTQAVTLDGGQEQDYSGKDAIRLAPAAAVVAGVVLKADGTPKSGIKLVLDAKGYGQVGTAVTGDDGTFRFDAVGAGPGAQYRVSVASEFESAATDWLALSPGVTDQLVLQSENRAAMAFGQGGLSGTVVTSAGAPVAGATVAIYRRNSLVKSVQTDASGTFRADSLPASKGPWGSAPDPYTLRVSKDGYLTAGEFQAAGQTVTDVAVPFNARAAVRVTLHTAVTDVRGRILNPQGEPVAAAEVYLVAGANRAVVPMSRTDAQGWYSFKGVPAAPGTAYTLRAKAAGCRPFSGADVTLAPVERQTLPAYRMAPDGVTYTGQVLGPDGAPVAGAAVELRGPDGGSAATAQADTGGVYRIRQTGLGAGDVTVIASQEGWSQGAVTVKSGTTTGQEIVISPRTAVLSGRVLGPDGQAKAGVTVELLAEGRGVVASGVSGLDGSYRFDGVRLDGAAWFWLRARPQSGTFGGSLRHQTELVPLLQLPAGRELVTDLLVK